MAVSGIDHTIKIFSPDIRSQKDAQEGINISSAQNGSFGSSSLSGRRRPRPDASGNDEARPEGLSSRKRMQQSYQICSQNDVQRQGGMRDAFITVRVDGPFPRMQMIEMDFSEWIAWMDS